MIPFLKLALAVVVLLGLVFLGLSLKIIFKRREPGCNDSDPGYSCGCGSGSNCSANAASKGIG